MRFLSFTVLILSLFASPAMATDVFTPDKDACASKDSKEFAVGKYMIIGQKETGEALPVPKDLYTATAEITLEGCKATVHRCESGKMETATLVRGLYMMEVPMWKVATKDREWYLELKGDKDNNALFHGWSEYWRMDPDPQWDCK